MVHRERFLRRPPLAAVELGLAGLAVGLVGVGPQPDERAGLAVDAGELDVGAAGLVPGRGLVEELDPGRQALGLDPITAELGDHRRTSGCGLASSPNRASGRVNIPELTDRTSA